MSFFPRKLMFLLITSAHLNSCGDDKGQNSAPPRNDDGEPKTTEVVPSPTSLPAVPTPSPDAHPTLTPQEPKLGESQAVVEASQKGLPSTLAKDTAPETGAGAVDKEKKISGSDPLVTELIDVEWVLRAKLAYDEFIPTSTPGTLPVRVKRTTDYRIEISKFSPDELYFSVYKNNHRQLDGTAVRKWKPLDGKNVETTSTKYAMEKKGYLKDQSFRFERDVKSGKCKFVYHVTGLFFSEDLYEAKGHCEL